MDDETILKGLKKRDDEVIKYFMDKVNPMVMKLVLSNSGGEEDGKEILTDATLALLKNLGKRDFHLTAKLSTYFYAIAQRMWWRKLRDRNKEIPIEDISLIVDKNISVIIPEDNDLDPERLEKVFNGLKEIDKTCQEVILMAHHQGCKHDEIAEEMNYTVQFVRQKLRRCLAKVRKTLGLK